MTKIIGNNQNNFEYEIKKVSTPVKEVKTDKTKVVDNSPKDKTNIDNKNTQKTIANPVINFLSDSVDKIKHNVEKRLEKTKDISDSAFKPLRVWKNEKLPIPPDKGGLKVTSFNIYLGGKRINEVEKELLKSNSDVICLQEASPESTRRLAKKLGMHAVFFEEQNLKSINTGKAILSKYPIENAKNIDYKNSFLDKAKSVKESFQNGNKSFEPLENRSMLNVSLKIGNKEIEIIDTHLSLGNSKANAEQIEQLTDYINQQKAKGKIVITAGDFNTNFGLTGNGTLDKSGEINTPTDTVKEFSERYKAGAGNIANPEVKKQADRLVSMTNTAWDKAENKSVIVDGKNITPEQAMKELKSGKVAKDSPRYKALLSVVDGNTHLGANKRFDNIFTTKNVKINSVVIDQTTKASDHQPVTVDLSWKNK